MQPFKISQCEVSVFVPRMGNDEGFVLQLPPSAVILLQWNINCRRSTCTMFDPHVEFGEKAGKMDFKCRNDKQKI